MPRGVVLVAHEYRPFAGGIATYAWELAAALAQAGVDVHVIAADYGDNSGADIPGVSVVRVLRHHNLTPSTCLAAFFSILRAPRDALLHGVDIRSALILYLVTRLIRRPFAITLLGSEVSKLQKRGPAQMLALRAYREADQLFAISQETLNVFRRATGTRHPVRVTHLGVNPLCYGTPPDRFENAELAAIDGKTNIICTVGRLDRRKGHDITLRSLATLKGRLDLSSIAYVIAGPIVDVGYADEVKALAREVQIPCVLTGRISFGDLRRLYNRSVCHVLSAVTMDQKIEGFGLVILEAAAQACPSVATISGGIPEIMRSPETGILCNEGDEVAIGSAIETYLIDPAARERAARAAFAHAKTFTWEACVHATYDGIVFETSSSSENI